MLVPSEFAKIAVKHGTVSTVSDPHEIANVLGVKGVEFMIENGNKRRLNSILAHHLAYQQHLLSLQARLSMLMLLKR